MLPRERIGCLLDIGSPFLELSPLAGDGIYLFVVACGGILTVFGNLLGFSLGDKSTLDTSA